MLLLSQSVPVVPAVRRTLRRGVSCLAVIVMVIIATGAAPAHANGAAPFPGYTLISPLFGQQTLLLNEAHDAVHLWNLPHSSGGVAYLLPDGKLLQTGTVDHSDTFAAAVRTGGHGYLDLLDWDGKLVWEYQLSTATQLAHHNIALMPNGHILLIVYELLSHDQAIAAGRDPKLFAKDHPELWSEAIYELDPVAQAIVWQWHLADHLIQDYDKTKANFGDPAQHPELVDFNYAVAFPDFTKDYSISVDWIHANAISYNPTLDQIVLNAREMSEFWILDHSTTTAQAAGHSGGRYGKGGDLLYRWGNPASYRAGTAADQVLWFDHDARWIPEGLPGAGHITVFDNGSYIGRASSRVVEIDLGGNPDGSYDLKPGKVAPARIVWEYVVDPKDFSFIMGAAQRLPNGNTLIADSFKSVLREVTTDGTLVWEYREPNNAYLFHADRYALDYPAFTGRALTPIPMPTIIPTAPATVPATVPAAVPATAPAK